MLGPVTIGLKVATTANTPAFAVTATPKKPPRRNAPGKLLKPNPGPPTQLVSLPKAAGQDPQLFARSPQSATHSETFPTMSKAPQADLQLDRDPVFVAFNVLPVLHSVLPSSGLSGVPAAAAAPVVIGMNITDAAAQKMPSRSQRLGPRITVVSACGPDRAQT